MINHRVIQEIQIQKIDKMSKELHKLLYEFFEKCYIQYIISKGTKNKSPLNL